MLLLKKNANFKERHLANGQIKSWRRLATLNNIIIIKLSIQLPPVMTWLLWHPQGFNEWYQKTITSPLMILEITKNLPRSYLKCINHLIITSST